MAGTCPGRLHLERLRRTNARQAPGVVQPGDFALCSRKAITACIDGCNIQSDNRVRSALREATGTAHEELDGRLANFDLAVTEGYALFLKAIAEALIPLERLLDRNGAEVLLPDWPARRRSEAIVQDLADLGQVAPRRELELTSVAPEFAWGILYTLEGSRLGSRVLLDRVAKDRAPTRYLAHGDGSMWRRFCSALEANFAPQSSLSGPTAGALYSFGVFDLAARQRLGA